MGCSDTTTAKLRDACRHESIVSPTVSKRARHAQSPLGIHRIAVGNGVSRHGSRRDPIFGHYGIVTDALQFVSGLKFTLNQGLPQEKLCALRQCVERILIDKPGWSVIVKIKAVPASTIQEVEELACALAPADAVAVQ